MLQYMLSTLWNSFLNSWPEDWLLGRFLCSDWCCFSWMKQQMLYILRAKDSKLSNIIRSITSRSSQWPFPSQHWRGPTWSAIFRFGLTLHEGDVHTEVKYMATQVVTEPKHQPYRERLRELGLFSLEKKKHQSILSMYINTWWKKGRKWRWGK